jgi:hypothetical protein
MIVAHRNNLTDKLVKSILPNLRRAEISEGFKCLLNFIPAQFSVAIVQDR